jgi:hypothetical protein
MTVRSSPSTLPAVLLALWLPAVPAAAAQPRWQSAPPKPEAREQEGCRELATNDPALDAVLRALVFQLADDKKPLAGVRLVGLTTVKEEALWAAIGGQPPAWDAAQAALLLRRLVNLGIFSRLEPVVEIGPAAGPTLVVQVVEQPTVRKVVLEGMSELEPEDLLEELLESPSREEVESRRVGFRSRPSVAAAVEAAVAEIDRHETEQAKDDDKQEEQEEKSFENDEYADEDLEAVAKRPEHFFRRLKRRILDRLEVDRGRCPDPLPPRDWLARSEGEMVFPGIVWKGMVGGLERVQARLHQRGYELASLQAALSPDGTLTVRIDEGRATGLQIHGVAPRLEARVRTLLGVEPGKPFVHADLEEGMRRIEEAYPFLRPQHRELTSRAQPEVEELPASDGVQRFRTRERPPRREHRWFTIQGGTLVVYFRARRGSTETRFHDLLRHTPVTSFAPGLETTVRIWDAENRAHLLVDVGGNLNTTRSFEAPPGAERWRFDGRISPRVQIPDLRVAEIGVDAYSLNDTADRWRLGPIDSYIYSLLINRPDTDYFRREGLTALLTFHLFERLTAGVEYRRDRYQSLVSLPDTFTIFNREEPARPTRPITNGQMGSLLVRVEYTTLAIPLHRLSPTRRDPERSILGADGEYFWTELRSVNTLEVANRDLGSDAYFDFIRLVSDSAVFLRTGRRSGIKLRGRAAGELDGTVPLQKREYLGGWSALRGYRFKEFSGDFSLLGTAELTFGGLSLWVDAGSVRNEGDFSDPRASLGGTLNFGDDARLDVAWRADGEARVRPEIRLLFERTF